MNNLNSLLSANKKRLWVVARVFVRVVFAVVCIVSWLRFVLTKMISRGGVCWVS